MDDELRALSRRVAADPGDRSRAWRVALAAERSGQPAEAVAALGALLVSPVDAAERDDLDAGLVREARAAGEAVGEFLAQGPLDQADACMRALVRRGALAKVVSLARRTGAVRSLTAARALLPTLGEGFVAADLPSPPALLALAEDEAFDDMRAAELPDGIGIPPRATGAALLDELLHLRALDELLRAGQAPEPGYLDALRAELATHLARGAPRAGWSSWKLMSHSLAAEIEGHALGYLPWLETLRFLTPSACWWHWDADLAATSLAAVLAAEEGTGTAT